MNTVMEKYESNVFQAGGCNWKLVLYPSGNLKSNGSYVSLYLAIADPEKISHGGEVNVNFKLFVFDQKNDNYLTVQDGGNVRTFCEEKTEWGFEKLVLLKDLFDKYIVKDSCVFGAEVFVIRHSAKSESLSVLKHHTHDSFKWKLEKFSTLDSLSYDSQIFANGEKDWILRVYPRGSDNATRDKYLSLYLELKNCGPNRTVYATYTLKILDQRHNIYHHQKTGSTWFRPSAAASKLAEASANKLHGASVAASNLVGASTSKLIGDSAASKLIAAPAAAGTFMGALASKWLGDSAAATKLKGASAAVNNWFGSHAMGFAEFISLSELNKEGNGYVKKNAIIIEVDIQISMIKISS